MAGGITYGKNVHAQTKQRIQNAIKLGTEVSIGNIDDIDKFYELMMLTESRKDFVSYSKDYYKTQYEILSKNNMAKLFLGKLNTTKIVNNLKEELKIVEEKINSIDYAFACRFYDRSKTKKCERWS